MFGLPSRSSAHLGAYSPTLRAVNQGPSKVGVFSSFFHSSFGSRIKNQCDLSGFIFIFVDMSFYILQGGSKHTACYRMKDVRHCP